MCCGNKLSCLNRCCVVWDWLGNLRARKHCPLIVNPGPTKCRPTPVRPGADTPSDLLEVGRFRNKRTDWMFLRSIARNASRILAIVEPSVCPSVRLSHAAIVSKRCKVRSLNLYCKLSQESSFFWRNFVALGKKVSLEQKRKKGYLLKVLFYRYWLV